MTTLVQQLKEQANRLARFRARRDTRRKVFGSRGRLAAVLNMAGQDYRVRGKKVQLDDLFIFTDFNGAPIADPNTLIVPGVGMRAQNTTPLERKQINMQARPELAAAFSQAKSVYFELDYKMSGIVDTPGTNRGHAAPGFGINMQEDLDYNHLQYFELYRGAYPFTSGDVVAPGDPIPGVRIMTRADGAPRGYMPQSLDLGLEATAWAYFDFETGTLSVGKAGVEEPLFVSRGNKITINHFYLYVQAGRNGGAIAPHPYNGDGGGVSACDLKSISFYLDL